MTLTTLHCPHRNVSYSVDVKRIEASATWYAEEGKTIDSIVFHMRSGKMIELDTDCGEELRKRWICESDLILGPDNVKIPKETR